MARGSASGRSRPCAVGARHRRADAVHYLRLTLSAEQVQDFGRGAVCVDVELPEYRATTRLNEAM